MPSDNLKEDFDKIFKEVIVPFSKELGFKRKVQNFSRQTNDIIQCFNIQKSKWNSIDNVSFTFNLGFFNQEIINLSEDKEARLEFPKEYDCFLRSRLGTFSHKRDHWYELNRRTDVNITANQVKDDLQTILLPLFEKHKSLTDLKSFVDSSEKSYDFIMTPYNHIVYLMKTNQFEKGKTLIQEHYKKANTSQISTQTMTYPNGRSVVTTSKPSLNQHSIDTIERLARLYNIKLK